MTSFWRNCHHWLHWELSFDENFFKMATFPFQYMRAIFHYTHMRYNVKISYYSLCTYNGKPANSSHAEASMSSQCFDLPYQYESISCNLSVTKFNNQLMTIFPLTAWQSWSLSVISCACHCATVYELAHWSQIPFFFRCGLSPALSYPL